MFLRSVAVKECFPRIQKDTPVWSKCIECALQYASKVIVLRFSTFLNVMTLTSTVSMVTCPPSTCSTPRTTPWPSSRSRAWMLSAPWRSPARSCCCASAPSGCTWTLRAAGPGSRSSCGPLCPSPPVSARLNGY